MRIILFFTLVVFCGISKGQEISYVTGTFNRGTVPVSDIELKAYLETETGTYLVHSVRPGFVLNFFDGGNLTELFKSSTPFSLLGKTDAGVLVKVNRNTSTTSGSDIILVDSEGNATTLFTEEGVQSYFLKGDELYAFNSGAWVRRYDLTGNFVQLSDEYSNCGTCDKQRYLFEDLLFYETSDDVWVTDGTPAGTKLIMEDNSEPFGELFGLGGKLYLRSTNTLLAYDIEEEVTVDLLRDLPAINGNLQLRSEAAIVDSNIIFIAISDDYGWEIFISDGTKAGTRLATEVVAGPENGVNSNAGVGFEYVGGNIIFQKPDENESEFWITDGTDEGTYKVFDLEAEDVLFRGNMASFERSDGKIILAIYSETTNETQSYIYSIDPTQSGQEAVLVAVIPYTLDNSFYWRRLVSDRFVTAQGDGTSRYLVSYGTEVGDVDTLDLFIGSSAYLLSNDTLLVYATQFDNQRTIRFSDGRSVPVDSNIILTSAIATGGSSFDAAFHIGDSLYTIVFTEGIGEGIYKINPGDYAPTFLLDLFEFTRGSRYRDVEALGNRLFIRPFSGEDFLLQEGVATSFSIPEDIYSIPGNSSFAGQIGEKFYYHPSGTGARITEINVNEATISNLRPVPINQLGQVGNAVVLKNKIYLMSDIGQLGNSTNRLLEIDPLTREIDTLFTASNLSFQSNSSVSIATDGTFLYYLSLADDERKLAYYDPVIEQSIPLSQGTLDTRATFRELGGRVLAEVQSSDATINGTRYISADEIGIDLDFSFTNTFEELEFYDLDDVILRYSNNSGLRGINKETGTMDFISIDGQINFVVPINNREALICQQEGFNGPKSLKITDGTIAGTRTLTDVPADIANGVIDAERFGAYLGLITEDNEGLYLYDPIREIFQLTDLKEVDDFDQIDMVGVNQFLYLMAEDSVDGYELHHLQIAEQDVVTGFVFNDLNADGVRDGNEFGLNSVLVEVTGDQSYSLFTSGDGEFSFPVMIGGQYSITAYPQNCIDSLTTDLETITFTYPNDPDEEFSFGYKTISGMPSVRTLLNSGTIRCGFDINFWLTVINDGCVPMPGEVSVTLGEEVTFLSSDQTPLGTDGQTITFQYDTLAPSTANQIMLTLRMPNEEFVGLPVEMYSSAIGMNDNAIFTSDTFRYVEELRCAIDPNDKQVSPNRPDSTNSNFTQLDETLRYTIRFQNTGNDTAFTVRIEDVLAPELDLETFRPLAASHPYTVSIDDERRVVFLFKDILLPDSTTNLLLSQGFVTFEINTFPDLEDFTTVENTVGIFFDFNRPVITNTVSSSMVEFLDEDEDGFLFFEECDDQNENVFPGAAEIAGNGIDEDCDGEDRPVSTNTPLDGELNVFPNPTSGEITLQYSEAGPIHVKVMNSFGSLLLSKEIVRSGTINLVQFPAGIYLLRVYHERTGQESTYKLVRK